MRWRRGGSSDPPDLASRFRRAALPLAAYYAVTLALPVADGVALSGAFVEHAMVVLVVPLVVIAVAWVAGVSAHALARACR